MKGTKMSDNKKMPETTIATLDMEGSGSLTLTNKHLRGQVLRVIRQGNMTLKQLEQVDVLLSAVGGYSVIDIPMKIVRIIAVVVCTVVAIGTWCCQTLSQLRDLSLSLYWLSAGAPLPGSKYVIRSRFS